MFIERGIRDLRALTTQHADDLSTKRKLADWNALFEQDVLTDLVVGQQLEDDAPVMQACRDRLR